MGRSVKKQFPGQSWEEYYRHYQYVLAERFLIPILRDWEIDPRGARVLEVGSGNGGCGAAFHGVGAAVTALEIDERLVAVSRELNERQDIPIAVYAGDICDPDCPAFENGPFDIIMMRDVIEHIAEPRRVLENIGNNLSGGGAALIVFPPYYSPFGGHQQIVPAKRFLRIPYNKLPFLQHLPGKVFSRIVNGNDSQSREVRRLRGIRLTIGAFESAASAAGFRIRRRKWYLSRPTFTLRYGLPVIEASFLGRIPGVRELAVTAAYYLLEHGPR
jgi:SAM-dependent methyltransferase